MTRAVDEKPISNARLAAELQAVALAIHIGGLDGLRAMTRPVNDHAAGYERERVNPKAPPILNGDA